MFARLSMLVAGALAVAAFPQAPSMDGVWRSQGYGYVFQVRGASLHAFEVTQTTCVPGFEAERDDGVVGPDREATYKASMGIVFFIRSGGTSDHKVLHVEGSASDMR